MAGEGAMVEVDVVATMMGLTETATGTAEVAPLMMIETASGIDVGLICVVGVEALATQMVVSPQTSRECT